ncbi:MAG: hemolysin III family protein [Treponemataceae bacterium]|nr:MAG: hemolysin III family protein [Treponemataceae bacterium]
MIRAQTEKEELANSILHGAGSLFSIAGLVLLVLRASGFLGGHGGGAKTIAACTVFTSALVLLFSASALYHAISKVKIKHVLQKFDHAAIYFLIAGTFTPICFLMLPATPGILLVIFEWALAIGGMCLQFVGCKFLKKIEVWLYLAMGWAIVSVIPFFRAQSVPASTLILIGAGGCLYSLGIIWYRKKTVRYAHTIWHSFVMAGAACHWAAIWIVS